jgi:hypothetical protein
MIGDLKVMRRDLLTDSPAPWEVYHVADDPAESTNLADQETDIIRKAVDILKAQTSPNELFPLAIPEADG